MIAARLTAVTGVIASEFCLFCTKGPGNPPSRPKTVHSPSSSGWCRERTRTRVIFLVIQIFIESRGPITPQIPHPEGDHFHLERVAVLPEQSGKGVGKVLIGYVERMARREGLKAVRLENNGAQIG